MPTTDALSIQNLSVNFGNKTALRDISLDIHKGELLGIIGPTTSGKTTFLTVLNRIIDTLPDAKVRGRIRMGDLNLLATQQVQSVRRRVGMIFALPVALPLTIRGNVEYGPRRSGVRDPGILDVLVEDSLKAAGLWEEVETRLDSPALKLSGGQQQRLCIARALALKPEVLLLDEPCSGLDPLSTARVEDTLIALRGDVTIVLVTNNPYQASRVADRTAFFLGGELVELNDTKALFTLPKDERTQAYIEGKFG